jgi:hypothetical protein
MRGSLTLLVRNWLATIDARIALKSCLLTRIPVAQVF